VEHTRLIATADRRLRNPKRRPFAPLDPLVAGMRPKLFPNAESTRRLRCCSAARHTSIYSWQLLT